MGALVETRSGKVEGIEDDGLHIFRGVPFAKPPIGELRFSAPVREQLWGGVHKAFEFGNSAPQPPMLLPIPGMEVGETSEDCLFLNVYTPGCDGERRPVMLWIHGGGFFIGSASQPAYDAAPLSRRGGVVVVTINYRLGALGYMDLSGLGIAAAAGNPGMRDQVAALEWVRECIEAFGGDPDNVTIFGESAGGMSVGTILGMPSARGLYHKAILQSGATHNVHERDAAAEVTARFLSKLGSTSDTLREASVEEIMDAQTATSQKFMAAGMFLPFQPVIDPDSIPVQPLEAVRAGDVAHVPLLVGSTRDEWRLFGLLDATVAALDDASLMDRLRGLHAGADVDALVRVYRGELGDAATPTEVFTAIETDHVFGIPAIRLAEAQQVHQRRTFMYRFDWEATGLGACHGVDIAFVFGITGRPEAALFASGGPEAERLANQTIDAWVAFARDGEPGHAELSNDAWHAYSTELRHTMLFDRECRLERNPGGARREAWDGIL